MKNPLKIHKILHDVARGSNIFHRLPAVHNFTFISRVSLMTSRNNSTCVRMMMTLLFLLSKIDSCCCAKFNITFPEC